VAGPSIFEPDEMLVFGKIKREILHEEEAIFCGADCGYVKAGRVGCAGGGGDPKGRDQRANVLSMEEAVCWFGDRSARQMKQLQEENSRLKQLIADLSLDKTMLQDVLRRKF
jgi:putative transposase